MTQQCPNCQYDLRECYLFQRKDSGIVHAVYTKHSSTGTFETDRLFGGGFRVGCGQKAEGDGTLSAALMGVRFVTCKRCLEAMGKPSSPVEECWPPESVRPLDRPRVLGIPG